MKDTFIKVFNLDNIYTYGYKLALDKLLENINQYALKNKLKIIQFQVLNKYPGVSVLFGKSN